MRERGVALIEILIAVLILALGFIPLLTLVQNETRHASFNEHQIIGRHRARRVAEALLTLGYDPLVVLAGTPAPGGQGLLAVPLPPVGEELKALALADPSLGYLKALERKMSFYQESATLHLVEPGLARVVVVVSWRLPSDPPGMKAHQARVTRVVTRREAALCRRHPLARGGG